MSLVRLLTAGKSLVGIQDSKSRYQLSDSRAMPKFGSEKRIGSAVRGQRDAESVSASAGSAKVEGPAASAKKVATPAARQGGQAIGSVSGARSWGHWFRRKRGQRDL